MADLTCPGCGRAMSSLALPRAPLAVDACDDCEALWLDRHAYPALLPCPRCTTPLSFTQDIQHTTRFTYYRCRYDHGRFTPYVPFLREKNFIRPLDAGEVEQLRAVVSTVRCVSCGGPVPLDRSTVCPYCGAPVMLLDPNAVEHALDTLFTHRATARRRIAPSEPWSTQ